MSSPRCRIVSAISSAPSSATSIALLPSKEKRAERDDVVVFGVAGTEEQRHRSGVRRCENWLPRLRVRFELRVIATLKFQPARGVMPEPLTELCAWSGVAEPAVDGQCLFLHPAGPEPFREKPATVECRRAVVNAFDRDRRRWVFCRRSVARGAVGDGSTDVAQSFLHVGTWPAPFCRQSIRPSSRRADSLNIAGVQGGSNTIATLTFFAPGKRSSASFAPS